jgi:hypothetical protein
MPRMQFYERPEGNALPTHPGSSPSTDFTSGPANFTIEWSFFWIFNHFIQRCIISRSSDSTVSENAGIEPKTFATLVLAVRRLARSHSLSNMFSLFCLFIFLAFSRFFLDLNLCVILIPQLFCKQIFRSEFKFSFSN